MIKKYSDSTKNGQAGFTLVELLVSMVILIILSSVSVFYFGGITSQARDARRKEDLDYLRKMLAVYYLDHGFFPTHTTAGVTPLKCALTLYPNPECLDLISELKVYSQKIPFDPNDKYKKGADNCDNGECYQYVTPDPGHSVSCVCANLEKPDASVSNPPSCQNNEYNYCLQVSY